MEHSNLPLKIGIEPQVIHSVEGKVICRTSYKNPAKDIEGVATAEFIVRACNSHYELLEACEEALLTLVKAFGCDDNDGCVEMLKNAINKAERSQNESTHTTRSEHSSKVRH